MDGRIRIAETLFLFYLMQELVLRDNQLKNIPDVTVFKKLLVFDVAFNEISSLHGLSRVSDTLKELYVSNNEVAKIEEIEHFHQLQILVARLLPLFIVLPAIMNGIAFIFILCVTYATSMLL